MCKVLPYLPAILAALTDIATTAFVEETQQYYPDRVVVFQIVMFGAALLLASSRRLVWGIGFVILLAGAWITGFSIGMFYLPTIVVGFMVMLRRRQADSFN